MVEVFRKYSLTVFVLSLLLVACARPAGGYSVLTHEEVIDLTWTDSIRPLLLKRFPNLTPPQLKEAHAYAYGGCLIQDLGYYPFGKPFFSNLLHYVRTGDFIRALFRDSQGPDDVAFAIGALAHYLGDTIGHAEAVDPAVATEFPKLAAKYGPNVNYAEGPHQHIRIEFAFDINDVDKHRLAPLNYLNHIGFAVPIPLLTRAFYDTYGLDLAKVVGAKRPTMTYYRYAVRSLLPRVAYAEALLHHRTLIKDVPSPALDSFNQQITALATADNWAKYSVRPGFGTHLLAGFIYILPKVGPFNGLSIRGPNAVGEQNYINSVMQTADTLRKTLAQATHTQGLANKDLDTGDLVYPGTYSLEDQAYADLLHQMTLNPSQPIPFGIKRDLNAYFSDLTKVKYIQSNPRLLAQVKADLPILQTISTKAQYPETAFLPEPEEDKPDPTRGLTPPPPPGADSVVPTPGTAPTLPAVPTRTAPQS